MRKSKKLVIIALIALTLSCFGIHSFAAVPTRGDMNSDGAVDDKDIEYLLLYSVLGDLFPDAYPMYQSTDLNGDEEFNEKDIEALLMHVAFPEFFPLAPDTELVPEYSEGLEFTSSQEISKITTVEQPLIKMTGTYKKDILQSKEKKKPKRDRQRGALAT